MKPRRQNVYIAVVSHRHGLNFYAAKTEKELEKKVAAFCRDWWGENMTCGPLPVSNGDIIKAYFNEDGEEFIEYGSDKI